MKALSLPNVTSSSVTCSSFQLTGICVTEILFGESGTTFETTPSSILISSSDAAGAM
jgi:hypothetical protein